MPIMFMKNSKCNTWIKYNIKHGFCKKYCDKTIWAFMHFNNLLIHSWELVVILLATVFWIIFAGSTSLPNNTSLDYPLQRVSILECRTTAWDEMTSSNCKINLPIIENANYKKYEKKVTYRDIYTVLWWAPYNDTWNQYSWAHGWVDIATAKWTPLYSIWEGKVYYAWWQDWYGNVVKIEYIVDGEHVFAVYWHMDKITVEKWDIVKKWEKIWTVWNSGNTFWALWWYHLHFEIVKDNSGRPMYSFLGCSDLNKWTYKVIMNGLCRSELMINSYDPIAYIEKYREISKPADWSVSTWETTNELIDKWKNDTVVRSGKVALNNETEVEDTKEIEEEYNKDLSLTIETGKNLIELDFNKVSRWLKHFISQRNIELDLSGGNNTIKIWDELNLNINVYNKKDWSRFVWLLKYSLGFITSNKNIETDLVNVQLIKSVWNNLVIKGRKIWKTTIIINFWWEKIWKLDIEVK